jgi:rare lipoprotein A
LAALRAQFERGGGVIPQSRPSPDAPSAPATGAGVNWQEETVDTPRPAPAANGAGYYVQLGAFSNAANAQRLATRAQSLGNVRVISAGNIRRVRMGPYTTQAEANQALARARSAGFGDARVFRDSGR